LDEQLYQYVNLDKQRVMGGRLSHQLISASWKIALDASFFSRASIIGGQLLSPKGGSFQGGLNITHALNKCGVDLSSVITYYGEQPRLTMDDETIITYNQAAYTMWGVSAGKSMFDERLTCRLGLNNILAVTNIQAGLQQGSAHTSAGAIPISLGRAWYVNLNWTLK
jgi:hypothetical protein